MEKAFITVRLDADFGKLNIKSEGTTIQHLAMLAVLLQTFKDGRIVQQKPDIKYLETLDFIFENPEEASIVLKAAALAELEHAKKEKIF